MPRGPKIVTGKPDGPSERPLAIGIDPSLSKTGLVALDLDGKTIGTVLIKPTKRGVDRLVEIRNEVHLWVSCLPGTPVHVCMEGYGFDTTMAHALGEAGGTIKLVLRDLLEAPACYPTTPAPSQVKKWATGKGTGEKSDIKLACYKRWKVYLTSNDEADAYVLARMALSLATGQTTTRYEDEVVEALKHPKPKRKGAKPAEPAYHAGMPDLLRYQLAV